MIRRAIVPGVVALVIAAALGWVLGGSGAAASAAIGIVIVWANFAAHGLSLAWASTVSPAAVMGTALGGFVVRLGVIVGAMFALDTLPWFSPLAFGLAVMPATLLLLGYEARLVAHGVGTQLDIPADAAVTRAGVPVVREA
jgi:hypothetical protein